MKPQSLLVAVSLFLLTNAIAQCATNHAEERIGPDSQSHQTSSQPGWANRLVELPRHESREYSMWINGDETFYFNSTPKEITELITLFSKIRLRDHVVEVKSGKPSVMSFSKSPFPYNVSLNVKGGISLAFRRLEETTPQTFEPVLTVYVGDADERARLEEFEWPNNLIIRSTFADLSLDSPAEQPERNLWYAEVTFGDGTPAADFEHKVSTTVTLWEKGQASGYDLGHVSYKGQFSAAFSETEIARLKNREMWLTMTVGNYLVKPSPDHPQLNIESLAVDKDTAKPVTVARQ